MPAAPRLGMMGRARRWLASAIAPRPRASVFGAASYDRLTADWFTQILSADQELKGDLRRLRGAARALVRDNSYASRFVDLVAENICGADGMTLMARARKADGGLDDKANTAIETAFYEWGQPETASVDGRLSWADFQSLVVQTVATDGEALVRLVGGFDNPFGFAVQLLDADLLDEGFNRDADATRGVNAIRMGVEVNGWGKPLAYHLWDRHPSEMGKRQRVRVDAAEIVHLYVMRRAGQTRGVTWFAPIMLDQKMLQGYQEAEITAARVAASNMFAIQYDPDKGGSLDVAEPGASQIPLQVEPGLGFRLGPGETLQQTNFGHPSTAFAPFTKAILRSIATGLKGVSYNTLANDLEGVNYSSIRAGLLSERDGWMRLQVWVAGQLHRRVFREWLRYALLSGALALDSRVARRYADAFWIGRRWPWVDPLNDIQAAVLERQHGFTTSTDIVASKGKDYAENLEQIAAENAMAERLKVPIGEPATAVAPRHDAPPPRPAREDDDDDAASARAIPLRPRQIA